MASCVLLLLPAVVHVHIVGTETLCHRRHDMALYHPNMLTYCAAALSILATCITDDYESNITCGLEGGQDSSCATDCHLTPNRCRSFDTGMRFALAYGRQPVIIDFCREATSWDSRALICERSERQNPLDDNSFIRLASQVIRLDPGRL